jgi:MFS family permease
MLRDYWSFGVRNRRYLTFGLLVMGLSSFGQTFFIALFGESLRAHFSISDGELGSLYALATFCSALSLGYVGRLIDHTSVRRFASIVIGMLVLACLSMAFSVNVFMLGLSFYLLRLFGQGLMVHTGLTATARAFSDHRGKALGLVSLGLPVGEAVLPIAAVASLALLDWRLTWALCAAVLVVLGSLALRLERRPGAAKRFVAGHKATSGAPQNPPIVLWRDTRFLSVLPVIIASPFISTGFFFHQTRLAAEKGWMMSWVAIWFVGYAAVRAVGLIGVGPVVDRFTARRLVPFVLLPMMFALILLGLFEGAWAVPLYLGLFGLTSAAAGTVGVALWAELYGTARLGRVRASVEAINVVATGASPMVFGLLVDQGVDLTRQAQACLAYVVVASALAAYFSRNRNQCPVAMNDN